MSFLTKNKRVLLLVDVSNIMYKAMHIHKNLTKDGNFTGGIYGFMAQVSTAIRENEATHIVFCFDRKPYFREEGLSVDYKAGREKSPETQDRLAQTEDAVHDLTSHFTKWEFDGLEADDLIAYAVKRYYHRFDKVIVQTSDTDPYQLFLEADTKLGFWKNQKDGLFTYGDFIQTSGFTTGEEWLALDAITGGHNGMGKGIVGYGPKRATDLIQKRSTSIRDLLYIYPDAGYNFTVMQLPHEGIKTYEGQIRLGLKSMSRKDLTKFCASYGIKMPPAWVETFTKVK
ncbi:5'-3' exonuclease [Vibrio phage VP06]|nr:5'-3' exonuclease [Vibrio phage VP06]